MKYLKILGLAAVAALALMAFAGAGSASASTLCKTKVEPGQKCPTEWRWPKGTTIHVTLAKEASAELNASGIIDTCTGSTVHGFIENEGTETENVSGKVSAEGLTWSGCTNTTKTLEGGTIEIAANGETETNGNGTVRAVGFRVTVLAFGTTCVYGAGAGTNLGTYTETTKHIDANTKVKKIEGSFLCPSEATWTATYVVTKPEGTIWVDVH